MHGKLINILLPLLVFVIINSSAYKAYKYYTKTQNEAIHLSFIAEADTQFNLFTQEMKSKVNIARSIQAFFQESESVNRAEFTLFVNIVLKEHPEILALNWLPRILHGERAHFEKEIKNEGFENFVINEVTADKQIVTAAVNDVYYPIKYSESNDNHKKSHLLNAISIPQLMHAISRITNKNEYSLSAPFSLIEEKLLQQYVLVFLPVYKKQQQIGVVGLTLHIKDVLSFFQQNLGANDNVMIELNDITEDVKLSLMVQPHINDEHHLVQRRNLFLGGRIWQMTFSPSHLFMAHYNGQDTALLKNYIVQGPLISLMVSTLLLLFFIQRSKAKKLAQKLKESTFRFETLLEKTGDAISLLDPGVRVIDCNNALVSMLGFDSKNDLMKHPAEISPEYQPDGQLSKVKSLAMDQQCLRDGHNQFEWLHQKKDGTYFWVDVLLSRIEYQGKTIIHVTARDITERKKYEAQLKLSEERLNQAREIAHMGNLQFNFCTNKLSCSHEIYKIYDIEPWREVTFSDLIERIHPEDREIQTQTFQSSANLKTSYTLDHRLLMINGDIKFIRLWVTTKYDAIEKTLVSIGSVMDITEQKTHEQELLKARIEADLANQQKSKFLANISHELRTPMHSILGFSNIGVKKIDTASTELLKKYFMNIQLSGNRLLVLINNLLDFSKLEAGKMVLDKKQANLHDIFKRCCLEQEQQLNDLNLTVQVNETASPVSGVFDPTKIGQVMSNILSNAIKFSPESSNLIASIHKMDNKDLSFTLQDQGIGIPNAELETVFDVFVQSSNNPNSVGGTGLGLAICQEIVAAHNGKIWAENNTENGVKFVFIIPSNTNY